jgi:hypothetical protein
MTALRKAEYLPELLKDWYEEDSRAYVAELITETERLVITATFDKIDSFA